MLGVYDLLEPLLHKGAEHFYFSFIYLPMLFHTSPWGRVLVTVACQHFYQTPDGFGRNIFLPRRSIDFSTNFPLLPYWLGSLAWGHLNRSFIAKPFSGSCFIWAHFRAIHINAAWYPSWLSNVPWGSIPETIWEENTYFLCLLWKKNNEALQKHSITI